MSTRKSSLVDRFKNIFTRRRTPTPVRRSPASSSVRESENFYLGTPIALSKTEKRNNTLYIFRANDDQLALSIHKGYALEGAEVDARLNAPARISTHLNVDCMMNVEHKKKETNSEVVNKAISGGFIIRLNGRTYREAYEEAKMYKANNCKIFLKGNSPQTTSARKKSARKKSSNEWSD